MSSYTAFYRPMAAADDPGAVYITGSQHSQGHESQQPQQPQPSSVYASLRQSIYEQQQFTNAFVQSTNAQMSGVGGGGGGGQRGPFHDGSARHAPQPQQQQCDETGGYDYRSYGRSGAGGGNAVQHSHGNGATPQPQQGVATGSSSRQLFQTGGASAAAAAGTPGGGVFHGDGESNMSPRSRAHQQQWRDAVGGGGGAGGGLASSSELQHAAAAASSAAHAGATKTIIGVARAQQQQQQQQNSDGINERRSDVAARSGAKFLSGGGHDPQPSAVPSESGELGQPRGGMGLAAANTNASSKKSKHADVNATVKAAAAAAAPQHPVNSSSRSSRLVVGWLNDEGFDADDGPVAGGMLDEQLEEAAGEEGPPYPSWGEGGALLPAATFPGPSASSRTSAAQQQRRPPPQPQREVAGPGDGELFASGEPEATMVHVNRSAAPAHHPARQTQQQQQQQTPANQQPSARPVGSNVNYDRTLDAQYQQQQQQQRHMTNTNSHHASSSRGVLSYSEAYPEEFAAMDDRDVDSTDGLAHQNGHYDDRRAPNVPAARSPGVPYWAKQQALLESRRAQDGSPLEALSHRHRLDGGGHPDGSRRNAAGGLRRSIANNRTPSGAPSMGAVSRVSSAYARSHASGTTAATSVALVNATTFGSAGGGASVISATHIRTSLHDATARMVAFNQTLLQLTETHAMLTTECDAARGHIATAEAERSETEAQYETLCGSLKQALDELSHQLVSKQQTLREAKETNAELKLQIAAAAAAASLAAPAVALVSAGGGGGTTPAKRGF